jgi:hypothetical protein
LSCGKTLSTIGHCWPSRPTLRSGAASSLLHDEEAKLKKYDDDIEKDSPGFGKTD